MKNLKRGLSNTFILSGGNFLSQGISFVGFLFVARELGPEDMGSYQTILAFIGMFTLLTFSGIERPIIRDCAKDPTMMKPLLESVIRVRILFSLLSAVVCCASTFFVDYNQVVKIGILIYSIELIFTGLRSTINTIYQSTQNMGVMSIISIIRSLISSTMLITLIYFKFGILSLVCAQVLTNSLILVLNYKLSQKYCTYNLLAPFEWSKQLILSGSVFSLIQFLNTFAKKSDIFILSLLGTPTQVGVFAVSYQLVTKMELFRGTIVQSFFPIFSKKLKDKKISLKMLMQATFGLFSITLAGAIIGGFLSNWIVITFFGEHYRESGQILSILFFYLVARFTRLPWDLCINTSHNETIQIVISLFSGFSNIILNIWFFHLYGAIGIAYSSVLTYSGACLLIILMGYFRLKSLNYFI